MTAGPTRSRRDPEVLPGLRDRKKRATRREIVLAGRRLFSTDGLYDSRIEDITERAGIAKGTLYLYFRSKEDLVLAVVEDGFAELRSYLEPRLAGSRDLEDAAARAFAGHLEFFADHPDLMRILHQVRGLLKFDRPRWRPLRVHLEAHLAFLAGQLAVGPAGARTEARRLELTAFLFGCASGASSVDVAVRTDASRLRTLATRWGRALGRAVALAEGEQGSESGDARNGTPRSARGRSRR